MKKLLLFISFIAVIVSLQPRNVVEAGEIRKNHFDFFTLDSHVDTPLMLSLPGFLLSGLSIALRVL